MIEPGQYDLIISGGGLVGASLALALAEPHRRIAVIEAVPPGTDNQPSFDDRSVALSLASRRILSSLDLWPLLAAEAEPITRIHVSDRGHFGLARLCAEESGVDALGHVIENRVLGRVLHEQLRLRDNITLITPARILAFSQGADRIRVDIEEKGDTRSLDAGLLIAADGARSTLRQMAHIKTLDHDYGVDALVANISTQLPHERRAFERFTEAGPLALLPLTGNRLSLVWSLPRNRATHLQSASDAHFMAELEAAFGMRLGRIRRVGKRSRFPLHRLRACLRYQGRLLLIGNAAQNLHPVAGQGFNLALRDLAWLAETLAGETDPGALPVLRRYEDRRSQDQTLTLALTDTLARGFRGQGFAQVMIRNALLSQLDLLPPVKRQFAAHAMGFVGRVPRLARGLPPGEPHVEL